MSENADEIKNEYSVTKLVKNYNYLKQAVDNTSYIFYALDQNIMTNSTLNFWQRIRNKGQHTKASRMKMLRILADYRKATQPQDTKENV